MSLRGIYRTLVVGFLIAVFAGPERPSGNAAEDAMRVVSAAVDPEAISANGKAALQAYLSAAELPDLQHSNFQDYGLEAKEFYESAGYRLPWISAHRPTVQAAELIKIFESAESEGLNPVDYDGPRWNARLRAVDPGTASESDRIRFDLAVTISTMRYVSDLHRGRMNPREFHFDLDIANDGMDLSEFLRQKLVGAADVSEVMRTVEPPFDAYRRTLNALQTYRKLASEEDGELLPVPPKPVRPGNTYSGLERLERRLCLVGDLQTADVLVRKGLIYQGPVVTAVKHFQRRHGLDATGIIDPHTFQELNIPLSQRVMQLELTLERWRWLPHEFAEPPLVVNIPDFRLYAANEEYRPAFSMAVVVGRSYKHQTPVFATQLRSVIFRPYWNVPLSIVRNELLSELKKDPNYLEKHSYDVVDAKENVVRDGPVTDEMKKELYSGKLAIRQRPGVENSLGLLKFDMPNGYDVYMHDTPATQLFARSRRDFSHGCIRVQDPVALAAWVLRDKPEWDTQHILDAMNGDTTFRVNLTKPIPVLILYGTATVTETGEVHFFDDIYGHDAELEKAIAKGYPYEGN